MYEDEHKRKKKSDDIWLAIIIAAFVMFWPAGIVLSVLKSKGLLPLLDFDRAKHQAKRLEQTVSDTASRAAGQASRAASRAAEQAARAASRAAEQAPEWTQQVQRQVQQQRSAEKQKALARKREKKLIFGKPMFITGLCLGGAGLIALVDELSYAPHVFSDLFVLFGLAAVGIYLTIHGILRMRQSRRLREYLKMIPANRSYVSLHQLADTTGRPYRQVCADFARMVELGIWDQAWIDKKRGRLMLTAYTEPAPEPKAQPTRAQTPPADPAEQVLARIRADNELIDDPDISAKIDRIELLTGKIFQYIRRYPEREPQVRTFLDYYLPQTLKILETYARLEAQGVETDNIRKAKTQISQMLDQLTDSYERQLDKLFDADVVDITADIEVMKQMLQKDGLADTLEFDVEKYR